ncbi:hypothetical protein [Pedosphaera parvula]|uniref:Uncharacterized protein n=1 Tax=Pedosphaera parvula (strain Ellin514) TaxID=320771 RepID=B9XA18_PEDPL|nr:hypothetical protein [Pedosphaera parvula]EEF63359.1 hypothetical protein Cflav_PD5994 [Pedosphaera parvula Ellin514]
MSTTTSALVIWNAETAARVTELVNSGKSVPAGLVQLAPKGFVSGLRSKRTSGLRAHSNVIIAQLESQGYRLEAMDGAWNPETKTFDANKTRRNGDEVCTIKLVKKVKSTVTQEEALAALGVSQADVEAVKTFLASRNS